LKTKYKNLAIFFPWFWQLKTFKINEFFEFFSFLFVFSGEISPIKEAPCLLLTLRERPLGAAGEGWGNTAFSILELSLLWLCTFASQFFF
jgi:hypothetical protein